MNQLPNKRRQSDQISSPLSRRFWVLIAGVLALVALALLVGDRDVSEPGTAAKPAVNTASEPTGNVAPSATQATSTAASEEEPPHIDTADYEQCQRYIRESQSKSNQWRRQRYQGWSRYLNEGYSLDEVTLAIEHIANSNFAAMFRATQLRRESNLALQSDALNEALRAEVPGFAEEGGIVLVAPASLSRLSFETMSHAEKSALLSEHTLYVDDIARAIIDEHPDDDILMLMDHVESLNAFVGYERLEATSILDYAIFASRAGLVEAMLRRGVSPTSDNYLGSSMEWALRGLSFAREERRDEAAEIVRRLKLLGAPARFTAQNEDLVEGFFPRNFYRFNAEQIASIQDDYQINLLNISYRELPELDENHPLVETLKAKRAAYLGKTGFGENFSENAAACRQTVHKINSQWQRQPAYAVVSQMIEEYGEGSSRLIGALAAIDPMLVDIYRRRLDQSARPVVRFEGLDEIYALLNAGEVDEAFSQVEALSLTDAQKRFARNELLRFDIEFYDVLSRGSLWVEDIQFTDFMRMHPTPERVALLEAAGADFRGVDARNNTLLYYAVEGGLIDLVTFLEAQGYPFSLDSLGQDPLHLALRPAMQSRSLDSMEGLVDVLMNYRPTIDEHHRSRMALLQLRAPSVYQSIISRHPELEIASDTPLPPIE